jgi:transposase
VVVAVCGLVCGCDDPTAIRRWPTNRADWLKGFLALPNGIPSRDCSDRGDADGAIADALGICVTTVVHVRKRFAAEGLEATLGERPRSGGPAKFDGKVEAAVVAVACSPVPEGRAEWTVGLIAGRLVELKVVESISGRTVGRVLKKARLAKFA